jgi:hypothetical protein
MSVDTHSQASILPICEHIGEKFKTWVSTKCIRGANRTMKSAEEREN